jgi:xylulokinase
MPKMTDTVIACDLGTGGTKAALFSIDGTCLAERVVAYETFYPSPAWHEQRPADWWHSVRSAIRDLLQAPGIDAGTVRAIAVSGHSLGCLPVDQAGTPLQERVPIWSDGRAHEDSASYFATVDEDEWYERTGNGFPAPLYPLFKMMWLRRHRPQVFALTDKVIGTKDYVNFILTGRIATDQSYASGSGVFDLATGDYSDTLLQAAGFDRSILPEIVRSTDVLGEVLPSVSADLGLPDGVVVVAGGVDNSCMALGARTFREGDIFLSMGSSSWLTVSSGRPLLDRRVRSYAFAHVVPDFFISATSIFSSGTSVKWVVDTLLKDTLAQAQAAGEDTHATLTTLAAASPRGANGLLFVPTLGGGTSFEGGADVRGAFVGLDLIHGPADVLRAAYEGVAFGLRDALDALRTMNPVGDEIIIVGGGAKSLFWRQVFADILEMSVTKTQIDQQAAALGAAALAFVGTGLWKDFTPLVDLHVCEASVGPSAEAAQVYATAMRAYRTAALHQKEIAPALAALRKASAGNRS